ncbi:MAG TPA: phage tail tip lysozyme, partial [Acidimicrobiia bacterium]|nr:phage tail tip lysozyme [Acidimicrobiia bacterium]
MASAGTRSGNATIYALTGSALERHSLAADPLTANVFTAWEYFVANTTLTRVQIAGLEGNLHYESGGALNPAQVQFGCALPPGPCGVGIAQWTDPGPRLNGLVALANSLHVPWTNLEVQLQYVWHELTHNPSFGLAALKACTTVSCATRVVETKYERPANQSTNCSDATASYCRRLDDANQILVQYGTPRSGYWMLGADGSVYPFGSASNSGSAPGFAVAITARPDGRGFWIVDAAGYVSHLGEAARDHGGRPPLRAGEAVSTISATPSGNGYWLFTNLGRVFVYGDAHFYGDMSSTALNGPIVASVATPTGHGYYMVGSDGGVFSFGDAHFHGSTGHLRLNRPVVGIAPTPDNRGYWLVASDGGVFAFVAPFRGSMGGSHLNRAVNGLVAYGNGYLMVASDGGVFDFSNKAFLGSLPPSLPSAPIIGIAA